MQLTSRAVSIAIGGCGPATPDRPVQCGRHRRPAVADPPHRSRVRLLITVSDHGTGSQFSHYSLWPRVWLVAALWRRAPTAFARDFVTDLAAGLGADFTAGRPAGKTTGRALDLAAGGLLFFAGLLDGAPFTPSCVARGLAADGRLADFVLLAARFPPVLSSAPACSRRPASGSPMCSVSYASWPVVKAPCPALPCQSRSDSIGSGRPVTLVRSAMWSSMRARNSATTSGRESARLTVSAGSALKS